jgi:hypothetical protein
LGDAAGDALKGKRKNIDHHHIAEAEMHEDDYFKEGGTHVPKDFRRRFRLNEETFGKQL